MTGSFVCCCCCEASGIVLLKGSEKVFVCGGGSDKTLASILTTFHTQVFGREIRRDR